MRIVQRIEPRSQQLHRLTNATGLVDAALLAQAEMHAQMQERVGLAQLFGADCEERGVDIAQISVVLGVLINPQAGNGFDGFEGLIRLGFGKSGAKEAANVGLRRLEQHGSNYIAPTLSTTNVVKIGRFCPFWAFCRRGRAF